MSVLSGLMKAYEVLGKDNGSKFKLKTIEKNTLKFQRTDFTFIASPLGGIAYETVTVIAGRNYIGKSSLLSKIRLHYKGDDNIDQRSLLDTIKLYCIQNMSEDEFTSQFLTWVQVTQGRPTLVRGGAKVRDDLYHLTIVIGIDNTTFDFNRYVRIKAHSMEGGCQKRANEMKAFMSHCLPNEDINVIVSHTPGGNNWGYAVTHSTYYIKTEWINRYCYVVFSSPQKNLTKPNKDAFKHTVEIIPAYSSCIARAKAIHSGLKERFPNSEWASLVKKKPGGADNWAHIPQVDGDYYWSKWLGDYCHVAWKVA